jgi:hypothetical protein
MREDSLLSLVLSLATVVFMFVFLNLYTIENNFDLYTTLSEVTVEVVDIEIVKQEEQIKDEVGGDVKNFSQDLNDGRETNNELAKNAEGENKTENQISEKEEIIVNTKLEINPNDFTAPKPSKQNNEFKYEGNVMVQWKMDNRTPHNNNTWYIRNPGYMCGVDEDGLLYLDVTINDMGDVIDVKINKEKSSNTNPCIIKYGVEYARMSRFSPSNNKQKGYIIYKFISQ